ncbi:NGG1p interacting factor NIF3 [Marinobacter hydrocarbonoclasticus]|nr:NGG1p interacting factor NIF3 [Marinobacter nauticus]
MKKLECYVPTPHLDALLAALFAAGAGRIGDYDQCCWVTEGRGQYRPLPGSSPFLGEIGQLHREPESKIELVFEAALKTEVVAALRAAHPYETPAYQILAVDT